MARKTRVSERIEAGDDDRPVRLFRGDRWFTVAGLAVVLAGVKMPFIDVPWSSEFRTLSFDQLLGSEWVQLDFAVPLFIALALGGIALAIARKDVLALFITGLVTGIVLCSLLIFTKFFSPALLGLDVGSGLGSGALVMLAGVSIASYGALASALFKDPV